jgi:uracil-DNA glycosylase
MSEHFGNDWDTIIGEEFGKSYYSVLREFLDAEYHSQTVYPPREEIFNAFRATPYADVRVVILGQDPYIKHGQAHGLSFSVPKGVRPLPCSLCNIFNEINLEFPEKDKCDMNDGCLESWTRQGVLLLNTVLTVRAGDSKSHEKKGWERFTDEVIRKLSERKKPVIFMLWGDDAKKKAAFINEPPHFILPTSHPSSQSAYKGFFGCGDFKRANQIIAEQNLGEPIDWQRNSIR